MRAASVGSGQIIGERVENYRNAGLSAAQEAWVAQSVRRVRLPPSLSPNGYACNALHSEQSAACGDHLPPAPPRWSEVLLVNGTYQPALYLLPGPLIDAFARSPAVGLWLGRATFALICWLLFALALLALGTSGTGGNLVGLLLATTPMVVFICSMLNPSGPEVAAGVAFNAGLLRLGRPGLDRRWGWFAAGGGGVVLCLSRTLGPAWLFVIGGVWLVWVGPRHALCMIREAPRLAGGVIGLVTVAIGVNRLWESLYGPKVQASVPDPLQAILGSLRGWGLWLKEQVGLFQYTDAPMPDALIVFWYALLAALVLAALWVGSWRDRASLVAIAFACFGLTTLLDAWVLVPVGWPVQGRHVLPLTVALPMWTGEIWAYRTGPRARRWLLPLCVSWLAIQVVAFLANGRRSAVGVRGSWWYVLRGAEWSPPGGWLLWACVCLLSTVLVFVGVYAPSFMRDR